MTENIGCTVMQPKNAIFLSEFRIIWRNGASLTKKQENKFTLQTQKKIHVNAWSKLVLANQSAHSFPLKPK